MRETAPGLEAQQPEREPNYTILQFNPQNHCAAEIAGLHLAVCQQQRDSGNGRFLNFDDSPDDLKNIGEFYINPGGQFFVAADAQNQTIGFIGLEKTDPHQGCLKRLAVAPDWRRVGIGYQLVDLAAYWARLHCWQKLSLSAYEENTKRIFQRQGFLVVSQNQTTGESQMELPLQVPGFFK